LEIGKSDFTMRLDGEIERREKRMKEEREERNDASLPWSRLTQFVLHLPK